MAIDPRIGAVTGCEITSNSGQPLNVTVVALDPDGRQLARAAFQLPRFSSRLLLTDGPADGFHCRFVVDGGKGLYVGAAKYQFPQSGIVVERAYLDR